MNTNNYNSVSREISTKSIGDVKMIRVFKSLSIASITEKEAFKLSIYEDIKFIIENLGKVKSILVKSKGFKQNIIIFKHENKSMSHIAVNFFNEPTQPVFRLEVVGNKGLIDYDSNNSHTIVYNKLIKTEVKNLDEERQYMEKDNDSIVLDIIENCIKKIG